MRSKKHLCQAHPVSLALQAADHAAQVTETAIAELIALAAIEQGNATQEDLGRLHFMVCMARELGAVGIGPEVLPLCAELKRSKTLKAPLLREVFELHSQQREAASPTQYLRAMYRLR